MAGTVVADKWQNGNGTENYKCRAWVNFNGHNTVAIRGSGNVSSITDNATGQYTVNFITAMPDVNYSAVSGVGEIGITMEYASQCNVNGPYLTTSVRITTGYVIPGASGISDRSVVQISIFR